ncbi:hypothetical protein GVN16_08290 [Emticicia sp. CRIBPO]|uniref:hypothetical protein n=1 Tax=Emticicia sp. CRIBPO TaxID=2683258 RepID=UPI001412F39C|nr:hypothetical protein [Emticicia sp. CRIBPO]NBA85754.1 hypothetical protein [Emticicia sp. CRIBPO]
MGEIIRGFDVLRTRKEFLKFEDSRLPILYKCFYSTFEVGINRLHVPGVLLTQINQVAGILNQQIETEYSFTLDYFLSIEESITLADNSYEKDDLCRNDFWPIGECGSNKNLLVGINSENNDIIYLENLNLFSDGKRYKFLADNIFEFITKISFIKMESPGYGIMNYNELYKEWGEDFYRIKK